MEILPEQTAISFELSMPAVNSWNGRWSGEDRKHVIIYTCGRSKKAKARMADLLAKPYHSYDFGDGWKAGVSLRPVTTAEARRLRKASAGFCGYDWMVTEILTLGRIRHRSER